MRGMLMTLLAALAAGCAGAVQEQSDTGRFTELGPHRRKVATTVPRAQAMFDQGLAFLYAFNHDEAIRSFTAALEADPKCAMAAWGIALANGPHINNPQLEEARAQAAWEALTKARQLADGAAPVERDLIAALSERYARPAPADRARLDRAYADAMRRVWKRHSRDADVGALFAEAMMNLRPWDLWTREGRPQPGTEEIVSTLESVLEIDPRHPLALHLYIHAVEASPEPGRADAAADRLRDLAPGLGHLVHMPSHIDVLRGRWKEAVVANQKAIAADDAYRRRSPNQGFYNIYMAHNRHMLAFAAMMRGQSAVATRAIAEMVERIPADFIESAALLVDGFFAMPYEVHVRFGRWDAMLAEREPRAEFPLTRALWHYARGVSLAARGEVARAKEEQKAFESRRALIPAEATFGNNASRDIAGVAAQLLEGEIRYREGKRDEAFRALRDAVRLEEALRYDEPPDWILPARHVLGAALMHAGRAAEAEEVYREDLARWPENGWSLQGLARSLEAQKKDASDAWRRFKATWRDADVEATSSCLCLPSEK